MRTLSGVSISNELIGELEILMSVLFMGVTFVLQRSAMVDGMLPLSYNASRYMIATLTMLLYKGCETLLRLFLNRMNRSSTFSQHYISLSEQQRSETETAAPSSSTHIVALVSSAGGRKEATNTWSAIFLWGSSLGLTSVGGSLGQQMGLVSVSAGKAAFITGLTVIVTPFVEWLLPCYSVKITMKSVGAATLCFIGLALVSGCAGAEVCVGGSVGSGEALVFASMFCWVLSILASDRGAKVVDVAWLSIMDFAITSIVTLMIAIKYEPELWVYPFPLLTAHWRVVVMTAIAQSIAFTLSNMGQEYTPPTRAALLYSMEGVATAIFGYIYLNETLSAIELVGVGLILLGTITTSVRGNISSSDFNFSVTAGNKLPHFINPATNAGGDDDDAPTTNTNTAERIAILENRKSFGSIEVKVVMP